MEKKEVAQDKGLRVFKALFGSGGLFLRCAQLSRITKTKQNQTQKKNSPQQPTHKTLHQHYLHRHLLEQLHLLSFLVEVQLLKKPRLTGESEDMDGGKKMLPLLTKSHFH